MVFCITSSVIVPLESPFSVPLAEDGLSDHKNAF